MPPLRQRVMNTGDVTMGMDCVGEGFIPSHNEKQKPWLRCVVGMGHNCRHEGRGCRGGVYPLLFW